MNRRFELWIRVAPFVLFVALTALQGKLGDHSQYWVYALKTGLAAAFICWARPHIPEIRVSFTIRAAMVGGAIAAAWVLLDPFYPKFPLGKIQWNPPADFGQGSSGALLFSLTRIGGSTLVVPFLEETFYRSFLYRYLIQEEFNTVPLSLFQPRAFFLTALIFGALGHREWLPGILCGLALQWLVLREGHLGEAITAHAVANLGLGLWVVSQRAWHFW